VLGSAWSDTYAVGLNNSGDIIGYGEYHSGQYGFLLTPIPEPPTWMMMLVGFAGLGFAARCGAGGRRRRAWRLSRRPTLRAVDLFDDKLPNL
jgi:hypothetical protein